MSTCKAVDRFAMHCESTQTMNWLTDQSNSEWIRQTIQTIHLEWSETDLHSLQCLVSKYILSHSHYQTCQLWSSTLIQCCIPTHIQYTLMDRIHAGLAGVWCDWSTDQIDWLTKRLIDRLIGCLIDWLSGSARSNWTTATTAGSDQVDAFWYGLLFDLIGSVTEEVFDKWWPIEKLPVSENTVECQVTRSGGDEW